MKKQKIIIKTEFQGIILEIVPHEKYEWILSNEEVAKGYGVDVSTIRQAKSRHKDELTHNKHFIGVTNRHTVGQGGSLKTFWTKRGIVRLGFFIKSAQAELFRDWPEDLIINHLESKNGSLETLKNELKQEIQQQQNEFEAKLLNQQEKLIHNLKQNFLEIMEAKTKQNNKDLVWQFWEYLNLVQGKLEERIEKIEPPKMEDLDDWNAYMYLMKKKNTTRHKLGKSGKPDNRRKNIQSNSGDEIELVLTIKMPNTASATALESYLKNFFKDKKIRGEWYNFEENDVMMMRMIAQVFETYFSKIA